MAAPHCQKPHRNREIFALLFHRELYESIRLSSSDTSSYLNVSRLKVTRINVHSRPDFRVFETGTGDCARRDEIVSRFSRKRKRELGTSF